MNLVMYIMSRQDVKRTTACAHTMPFGHNVVTLPRLSLVPKASELLL